MDEFFDVYNADGSWRGLFPRSQCHGDPDLIHKSVHVVVLDSTQKKILLQKRSPAKDIQPGKWDTAVGGHVAAGESVENAARRELAEELGITGEPEFFFASSIKNELESEIVTVFKLICDGPFDFSREEIDEVQFFELAEFEDPAKRLRNDFTPNLQKELADVIEYMKKAVL
ncbi:MAG: NUDIX domain-containing protein [Lentisphaeria bacterium]|nr:NUDIX domain-containing protein [Lentisphaeria bacterium]